MAHGRLFSWAMAAGVLPGRDVLPSLPGIDWLWAFHNPRAAAGMQHVRRRRVDADLLA